MSNGLESDACEGSTQYPGSGTRLMTGRKSVPPGSTKRTTNPSWCVRRSR